jgi:hypothetical protein
MAKFLETEQAPAADDSHPILPFDLPNLRFSWQAYIGNASMQRTRICDGRT